MTHLQSGRPLGKPHVGPASAADIATEALGLKLGATPRAEMDRQTVLLTRRLKDLLHALPAEKSRELRDLHWDALGLFERAPRPDAPTFSAHSYMRALARVLRRLDNIEASSDSETPPSPPPRPIGPCLPSLSTPSSEGPSGTYRVPSGLPSTIGGRWQSLTTHRGLW